MTALLLSLLLSAGPSGAGSRVLYEQKCLYCHSAEVAESHVYTPSQWRRVIERMRLKAPLLITHRDAKVLTQYMVQTLKLVRAEPKAPRRETLIGPAPPRVEPPPPIEPAPLPEPEPDVAAAEAPLPPEATAATVATAAEVEAIDVEGAELMERRCSKCHTVARVYSRLTSYERSLFTVRRMRLKTGSGISKSDLERIELFLRRQFSVQ